MEVPNELMERIYATLQHYANPATYQASRTGGVLAGCPRGPEPTPSELAVEAASMVRQIDAALKPPAKSGGVLAPAQPGPQSAAGSAKGNVIIFGDEIHAGIDLDDVKETGPLKWAVVMQFDSVEAMRAALARGSVEFDLMRDARPG